ncbi:MAG: sodium ion-translocating decarboxylase subunit beta [Candidatus Sumerlaeia bacterium]|nr:sodium ion-translocating decarboxylase subunit beta [Candidatus Sumerlaeia bacterium]
MESLLQFLNSSGFGQATWGSMIMLCIGMLFIWLAIKKGFEPLLLVPIGFGILLGNIPYSFKDVSLSVYDGPAPEHVLDYYAKEPVQLSTGLAEPWTKLDPTPEVRDMVRRGTVVMVNREQFLGYHGDAATSGPGVYENPRGGRAVLILLENDENKYPVVIPHEQQNLWNASVMWMIFRGIEWGVFPPLIFLGIGALTDFGPLLASPRLILLGAAAQLGIFGALCLALLLGFDMREASSIGIIGGADGPTAIFTCTKLAPHLLGAVALAAYSYMAMVPLIQPPIMRLLTTREERLIRMKPPKDVSRTLRVLFPVLGFLLTAFIANSALPLLGFLFFGNLLRECLVTERLSRTAQTTFIDIVTILLGVSVGAKTQASNFLTPETLGIFVLGVFAFGLSTAGGVLFGKLMNKFSKDPINPLIGAAGVSAVPMSARVVQRVAQEEDPQNFLLMQAMGPNVAGVIGSAVAAGVLLSQFAAK